MNTTTLQGRIEQELEEAMRLRSNLSGNKQQVAKDKAELDTAIAMLEEMLNNEEAPEIVTLKVNILEKRNEIRSLEGEIRKLHNSVVRSRGKSKKSVESRKEKKTQIEVHQAKVAAKKLELEALLKQQQNSEETRVNGDEKVRQVQEKAETKEKMVCPKEPGVKKTESSRGKGSDEPTELVGVKAGEIDLVVNRFDFLSSLDGDESEQLEEFRQLESNIMRDGGITSPLVATRSEGRLLLLDGHLRYKVAVKHDIPFSVITRNYISEEDSKQWVAKNQLGRRNLSASQASYLRGKYYDSRRQQQGGDNSNKQNILKQVAEETCVSDRTLSRDLKHMQAVDRIVEATEDPRVKTNLLAGGKKKKLSQVKVIELGKEAQKNPEKVKEQFVNGKFSHTQKIKQENEAKYPYEIGDIVEVKSGLRNRLKAYGSQWGVITDFNPEINSCSLQLWSIHLKAVPCNDLNPLDYTPEEAQEKAALAQRLYRITENISDPFAYQAMLYLGRSKDVKLTELQERSLQLFESTFMEVQQAILVEEESSTKNEKLLTASTLKPVTSVKDSGKELVEVNISTKTQEKKIANVSVPRGQTALTINFVRGTEDLGAENDCPWYDWTKYLVEGLEEFEVESNLISASNNREKKYSSFTCENLPEGMFFTIQEKTGDNCGTKLHNYMICRVEPRTTEHHPRYGRGEVKGSFQVIARAETHAQSINLRKWWQNREETSLEFAIHCKKHIKKANIVKDCPTFEKLVIA
jgi:hypothetical protein